MMNEGALMNRIRLSVANIIEPTKRITPPKKPMSVPKDTKQLLHLDLAYVADRVSSTQNGEML